MCANRRTQGCSSEPSLRQSWIRCGYDLLKVDIKNLFLPFMQLPTSLLFLLLCISLLCLCRPHTIRWNEVVLLVVENLCTCCSCSIKFKQPFLMQQCQSRRRSTITATLLLYSFTKIFNENVTEWTKIITFGFTTNSTAMKTVRQGLMFVSIAATNFLRLPLL